MKKIVAFVGVIGSGKDHNAKILQQNNPESKVLGFSDGVREFTWGILKWKPENDETYEHFKDHRVAVLSDIGWLAVKNYTGRELLENVADQMRRYDDEFWGNYWMKKAKVELATTDLLIVPDCRHVEEASKIVNLGSHLGIHYEFKFCDYKSPRYEIRNHSSERFAQNLLAMGLKDGQICTEQVCETLYG